MRAEINFDSDLRFLKAKYLFDHDMIRSFDDLFKVVPKTVIAKELNVNTVRLTERVTNPRLFRVGELQDLAGLINIRLEQLIPILYPAAGQQPLSYPGRPGKLPGHQG